MQAHEQALVANDDPATLSGHRLARYERIQADKSFRELAGQFARIALELPRPADVAKARLDARALDLLARLESAYRESRQTRPLDLFMDGNRTFLKNTDWNARERSAVLRDEIIAREVAYTRLVGQAHDLVAGQVGPRGVQEMSELLRATAPQAAEGSADLAVQVLSDPALRQHVLDELKAVLADLPPPPPPPRSAGDLTLLVTKLQLKLIESVDLAAVISEHAQLEAALEGLDAQIRDVEAMKDLETRQALVEQIVARTSRRNALEVQWYSTPLDGEVFPALVAAHDELILRLVLDLGTKGAFFAPRRDEIAQLREAGVDDPPQGWRLLQSQQALVVALTEARPAPDPLAGLAPPPYLTLTGGGALQAAKGAGKGPGKGAAGALGKAVAKPKAKPKPKAPGKGGAPPKLIEQGKAAAKKAMQKPR